MKMNHLAFLENVGFFQLPLIASHSNLQIRDATTSEIDDINQEDEFLQIMQNCGESRLLTVSNRYD